MSDLRLRLQAAGISALMRLPRPVRRLLAGPPRRIDGHELHLDVQLLLRAQRLARVPEIADLPLAAARRAMREQSRTVGGRQPIGEVRDLEVPGAGPTLPARLYTPRARVDRGPVPTLLFFHGGGWTYGDLDTHDATLRVIAEASSCQVLSVAYRLAPEHPHPAALEDGRAALRWLAAHAGEVGADRARIAVGGDSAGAWLAAQAAVTAAYEGLPLALQLLIYPGTDFVDEAPSRGLFQDEGLVLTRAFIGAARELCFADVPDLADPDVSPLRRTELPGALAPAQVLLAGLDPLRDEGRAYADLLAAHGVPVEVVQEDDLVHGFIHFTAVGRAVPDRVAAIGRRLGAGLS